MTLLPIIGIPFVKRFTIAIDTEKFKVMLEYISPKGLEKEDAIQFEIRAAVELSEENFIRAGYSANADIVLDIRERFSLCARAISSLKRMKYLLK